VRARGERLRLAAPRRAPRAPRRAPPAAFAAPPASRPLEAVGAVAPAPALERELLKDLPLLVESPADDPSLANPRLRAERLGTGWLGVVLELEGVAVDYEYGGAGAASWAALAAEEGRPAPPRWALARAEGMKAAQAVQELFCWTRAPAEVRRLAARREALLAEALGDRAPLVPPGLPELLATLARAGAPAALVSAAPEARVLRTLAAAGLAGAFAAVVTGDDVQRGRPDPEGYLVAAQRLGRPPLRCVVVGAANASVEAAHEVGMRAVAVAGPGVPGYELGAADLVVRSLAALSFVDLKRLFADEEAVAPRSALDADAGSGALRDADASQDEFDDFEDDIFADGDFDDDEPW
jgi:HAD superfamily hydrolase (TIGR01509 family)